MMSDACEGVGVERRSEGGDCRCFNPISNMQLSSGWHDGSYKRVEALRSMYD